jgi:hypothetical protein
VRTLLESFRCLHIGVERARADSSIQGNCEMGRVSGVPILPAFQPLRRQPGRTSLNCNHSRRCRRTGVGWNRRSVRLCDLGLGETAPSFPDSAKKGIQVCARVEEPSPHDPGDAVHVLHAL